MWPAALGPRNPNDAVQKVHVVPPQVEEAAPAQARMHSQWLIVVCSPRTPGADWMREGDCVNDYF